MRSCRQGSLPEPRTGLRCPLPPRQCAPDGRTPWACGPSLCGWLVRIDEAEGGIVSQCEVLEGNPADTNAWSPALEQHEANCSRPPDMATGDRGSESARNG